MLDLESGWQLSVDYSTEWVFFRLETVGAETVSPALSERLWEIARERGIKYLVCELGEGAWLTSYLIGQLVLLHKRAHLAGGRLRVCGLSDDNYSVLSLMHLADRFPNYETREGAVMGYSPRRKPR
jgi:anti-anti-sigma regulatory factor